MTVLRSFLLLMALLVTVPAYAAVVTNCAGLQAAVAVNNSDTEIHSDIIDCTSTVSVTGSNVQVRGTGRIISNISAPVLTVTGYNFRLQGLTLWNVAPGGDGLSLGNIRTSISNVQINTNGWGIYATGGSGLFLHQVHFNWIEVTGGSAAEAAILVGVWDTVDITSAIIEQHDVGMRFGWFGATANVLVGNLIVDRSLIGLMVNPTSGGSINNLMVGLLWGAGRPGNPGWSTPMLVDSSTGAINTVRVANLYATGFPTLSVSQWGSFGGAGLSIGWQFHQP